MSTKEGKNVVASVLARLRDNSKSSGAPFQQVLQQYARAIPVSGLEVETRAKCYSERRATSENHRHPECASYPGYRHVAQGEG
jgi:hypothetical protein